MFCRCLLLFFVVFCSSLMLFCRFWCMFCVFCYCFLLFFVFACRCLPFFVYVLPFFCYLLLFFAVFGLCFDVFVAICCRFCCRFLLFQSINQLRLQCPAANPVDCDCTSKLQGYANGCTYFGGMMVLAMDPSGQNPFLTHEVWPSTPRSNLFSIPLDPDGISSLHFCLRLHSLGPETVKLHLRQKNKPPATHNWCEECRSEIQGGKAVTGTPCMGGTFNSRATFAFIRTLRFSLLVRVLLLAMAFDLQR